MSDDTPDELKSIPGSRVAKSRAWQCVAIAMAVVTLAALLTPVWREFFAQRHREQGRQRLKTLMAALHNYHDAYNCFPPAYTVDQMGEKLHSWRALILPFVGQEALYSQIRFDEPWNSPHNTLLSKKSLKIFTSPAARNVHEGQAHYFAIVGPVTAWPEQYSVNIRDIRDGSSATIMLVEANVPGVNWMEPRDITRPEAIDLIGNPDGKQRFRKVSLVGMGDGTVRSINPWIERTTLSSIMSINGGTPFPGVDWPEPPWPAEIERPGPRNANELERTEVWPVTDREIVSGKNFLYCCTFQLAWDDARNTANGAPIELEGDPSFANQMNAHSFPTRDLSPTAYVAKAGAIPIVVPIIDQELHERFPRFQPRLLQRTGDNEFVAYAYLQKNLPFRTSFDRLTHPLSFVGHPVDSFGVEHFEDAVERDRQLGKQVIVLEYRSPDDFIVLLTPRESKDEILLGKVSPGKTLRETIMSVSQRFTESVSKKATSNLRAGDSLKVPVLTASIERTFEDLIGRKFLTPEFSHLKIVEACQIIRFQLDENGAKLESEAAVIADDEGPKAAPHPRKMVFDKPFLIWLRETQATEPYFAAWIENTELMMPFAR